MKYIVKTIQKMSTVLYFPVSFLQQCQKNSSLTALQQHVRHLDATLRSDPCTLCSFCTKVFHETTKYSVFFICKYLIHTGVHKNRLYLVIISTRQFIYWITICYIVIYIVIDLYIGLEDFGYIAQPYPLPSYGVFLYLSWSYWWWKTFACKHKILF